MPHSNMIAEEIIPALLSACPSAEPSWTDHLGWWGTEERGYFNDMSFFAAHVVESYFGRGTDQELPAFFEVVERMIRNGDAQVRDLAIIGLIEDIQNGASWRDGGGDVLKRWLGVETLKAWSGVEAMWSGVGSLADMVRLENSRKPGAA